MGGDESDDSLVSIVRGRVVVDGVSSSRDSVGCKITSSDGRVKVLGRVDLGHVGAEGSDSAVGCTERSISVTGNDENGLGEARSVEGGGGADGVWISALNMLRVW